MVVGAGISGLAAAHFFREAAGPLSRVLLLDNHDDFGGHARRNEFTLGGRTLIGYGDDVHAPGSYHTGVNLNLPVSIGDYRFARGPEEPIVVHLAKAPCRPGLPAREQHRAGRTELLTTSFPTFERNIRDQLARMLGPSGLDPARDIAAITVNRWPHGYAYQYNSLFDPFWLENGETPCMVARRPFGLVAIANSDAAAYAYTDAAIDQAFRAVQEILPRRG